MFLRRLGSTNQNTSALCAGGYSCPHVLEMQSGDYAIVGTDITEQALGHLLPGAGCGPDEKIVRVPRSVLIQARADIPALV